MKNVLMQCLVNEQEISVKNSIAQLIGVLSKYELPMLAWPELLNFLHHTTNSSNTNDQELGFYTLSILTEIAPDEFRPIAQTFMALFKNTLKQLTDLASPVAFFIIVSIVHLGPIIRTDREVRPILFGKRHLGFRPGY
ncbi:hypothetical protein AAG570_004785 [Ranatra chinensis]|uniref:IPO4/5-like TPR repeats domain-containing protein n=1 Tax=Ranatra chinensis TaxID=642074 RepID=A0ABD0Y1U3_9HEMI